MKIVRFLGGLGNQMFQYVFYKSLQLHFKSVKADLNGYRTYSLHNGFELERIFNLRISKANKFAIRLFDPVYSSWTVNQLRTILRLKHAYYGQMNAFAFEPEIYQDANPKLYWGYWQNINYFSLIEEEIRRDFKFTQPLSPANQLILNDIKEKNSVAVHVRLGDYVKDPLLGGICDKSYYQEALLQIGSKVNNPFFYIFSDDINWCRKNLFIPNAVYISQNHGANSYIDMQLMSNCKHNIIANSSFSWWAAWLNANTDKVVIAPYKWVNELNIETKDITPADWIRI